MIDGGIILILLSMFLMLAGPIERQWSSRKVERTSISVPLANTFPVPSPDMSLEQLVVLADDALARDRASRPVIRIQSRRR